MFSCPLHNWNSFEAPCPACSWTVTTSTTWLPESPQPSHTVESQIQKQYAEKGNQLASIVGTISEGKTAEELTMKDVWEKWDNKYDDFATVVEGAMSEWAAIVSAGKDARIKELEEHIEILKHTIANRNDKTPF